MSDPANSQSYTGKTEGVNVFKAAQENTKILKLFLLLSSFMQELGKTSP